MNITSNIYFTFEILKNSITLQNLRKDSNLRYIGFGIIIFNS